MKRVLIMYFLVGCTFFAKAQLANNAFTYTNARNISIPLSFTYSTSDIATYINLHCKTGMERLETAYHWIINNIQYDSDSMYVFNADKHPEARITESLRRRKGVCENYAAIFNDIAVKCGITSYVVSGYTKQAGRLDRSGHSWCAILLDNEWRFCDPTWDEGSNANLKWFMIPAISFIESHMPFDPLWQLLNFQVSHKDFYAGNFYPKKDEKNIPFADAVHAWLELDSLSQLEAAVSRIERLGIANDLVRNRLAYLRMKAGIIYEEHDMKLYNEAVAGFNSANAILNAFIVYRNNQFLPVKPDSALNTLLDPIDNLLKTVYAKLDELSRSETNYQYDPGILKNRMNALAKNTEDQKIFLKQYIAIDPGKRKKIFYK